MDVVDEGSTELHPGVHHQLAAEVVLSLSPKVL